VLYGDGDAVVGGDVGSFLALPPAQKVEDKTVAGIANGACGQPSGLTVATVMMRCSPKRRRIISFSARFMVGLPSELSLRDMTYKRSLSGTKHATLQANPRI
jgi:hypothetical protein